MGLMRQTIFEQAVLFLAAMVVFTSFLMLAQRRLFPLIGLFAWQGLLLAATTALVAYNRDYPHLYVSALITLVVKTMLIPWMLRRWIIQLDVHRDVESLLYPSSVMAAASALVLFSYYVVSTLATRNAIAVSFAVVLLGMLLMIARRQAVTHVIGFMSIENGLFFAAVTATSGMPMVVELGVAFDVLVAAVLFGVFFFHIRSSIDSLDVDQMNRLHEVEHR
jgi:hydrogenase-4 component E